MAKVVRLSAVKLGSSHPTSIHRKEILNEWLPETGRTLLTDNDNLEDAAPLDARETEPVNVKDITNASQRSTKLVEDNNTPSTAVSTADHMKSLLGREKTGSYVEGKVNAKPLSMREKTMLYLDDKTEIYELLKGGPKRMAEGNKLLSQLYRELITDFLLE